MTGLAGVDHSNLLFLMHTHNVFQRLNAHLHACKTPPYVVNLDPAVREVPFPTNIGTLSCDHSSCTSFSLSFIVIPRCIASGLPLFSAHMRLCTLLPDFSLPFFLFSLYPPLSPFFLLSFLSFFFSFPSYSLPLLLSHFPSPSPFTPPSYLLLLDTILDTLLGGSVFYLEKEVLLVHKTCSALCLLCLDIP